ncbi:extracellular solute-binding protein [Enterococcus lemanii]|uniref:Extracellular solute-binding protein n=1 Tax=Enterococcus lemanii TaxID=1159752 RepID=A0ABV9MT85_9ENTE|nr:extracellular solute-binding protein [Enterococcus lemanii]MBM7709900.1 arabinogalactan oligomer/maltooligosaccharide transport system substrate-binding protein [Enterococcus lemanii]
MKKMTGLLLFSALAFGLGACGPGEGTTTGKTNTKNKNDYDLLVWEDQDKKGGIEEAVKQFEEENDVKIKVVEKAYAGQVEDLRLDGPAGTGADVITIPADQIGTAVTEGLLAKLDIDAATQELYTEAAMQSQIVDGNVYGLPKAVETQILYYNKALVAEADLPTTTDEWFDFSKEMLTNNQYGLLALWDQLYYAQGIMSGYGGYVFGQEADGTFNSADIGLANQGAVEAGEYIQEFYQSGVFPTGIIGEQGINVLDSLFTEGKAAAVISGPWNLTPYKEAGIDYGVKELPLLSNGEHMGSFIGVKSYNVSSYSKNTELAQKFVEFITNAENSAVRYEKTLEVPAVISLADNPLIQESESALAVSKQSQFAKLTPGITAMNAVWEPTDAALQTIATGKGKPSEVLPQAVEQIKASIAASSN